MTREEMTDEIRERRIAALFRKSAPFALLIGLVMILFPVRFWQLIGIDAGADAVIATLYGGVLIGVGVISHFGARAPMRHASLLLFMTAYKAVAVSFLIGHALIDLIAGRPVPIAVWIICLLWGRIAFDAARLYPWHLERRRTG